MFVKSPSFFRTAAPSLGAVLLLAGCFVSKDEVSERSDYDGDKVPLDEDCDDNDASVGAPVSWYADVDGDGFGAGDEQSGCPDDKPSTNTADNADDCDDSNPSAFPGAEERYYDGIDQDCAGEDADGNGSIDDFDQDADGYEQDVDCDDLDASLKPDPSIDEVPYDGIDNDCDLTTGDGDADGDGYWSADYATKAPGSALSPPTGFDGDCYDDADDPEQAVDPLNGFPELGPEEVHPAVTEDIAYDGIDAACDGDDREFDADGDGFTSAAYDERDGSSGTDCQDCVEPCDREPNATTALDSDQIHPDATEVFYDGVDQDCLGIDALVAGVEHDYDQDGDGHVISGSTDAFGNVGDDCLDTDDRLAPGNTDTPGNGLDEDCGGENDYDYDLDGYVPDAAFGLATIGVPGSETTPGGDCVDDPSRDTIVGASQAAARYNPGQSDGWGDGFDYDCAGNDDYDHDADGYRGDTYATSSDLSTRQQTTTTWAHGATTADDCDDDDSSVNPGVAEVAGNGLDDNCDEAGAPEGIHGTNTPDDHHSGAVVGASSAAYGQVLAAGDLDDDGQADLVIGAYGYDTSNSNVGAVAWYSGADLHNAELDSESDAAGFVRGEASTDYLGRSVGIGDVTGDGYDDLLMGAPYVDNGGSAGTNQGGAFIFEGPLSASASATSWSDADLAAFGDGGLAGWRLAAGEVTGDSTIDLVVSAPYTYVDTDYAGLLLIWKVGSATSPLEAGDAALIYGEGNGYLGYSSLDIGDLDGDGSNEIIAGSELYSTPAFYAGTVYAVETPVSGSPDVSDVALLQVSGEEVGSTCGRAVAIGDYDNDGYDDLAVGCPGVSGTEGGVAVFLGGTSLSGSTTYTSADTLVKGSSDVTTGGMGYALDIGDITGDGKADLVVGEQNWSTSAASQYTGRALLFESGATGSLDADDADGQVVGDRASGYLGAGLVVAPDVDGDGTADLLVGRTGNNIDSKNWGDVLLFTGGEW